MPSFRRVLAGVADAWQNRRDERGAHRGVDARAVRREQRAHARAGDARRGAARRAPSHAAHAVTSRASAASAARPSFRRRWRSTFALRQWARTGNARCRCTWCSTPSGAWRAAGSTIRSAAGSRATRVDAYWLVPHFEKMLYDNALLVRLGAQLWQATRDDEVRRVTEETLGWLAREMTSPKAASTPRSTRTARDTREATTCGTPSELDSLLGEDAALLKIYWGVTAEGNFEGRNILFVPHDPEAVAQAQGVTPHELRRRGRARAADPLRGARAARASRAATTRSSPHGTVSCCAAWPRRRVRSAMRTSRAGRAQRRVPLPRAGARRPRVPQLQGGRRAHRRIPRGSRRGRARRAGASTS